MPGALGDAEVFTTLVEPMEIVSLTGPLCPDGLHVHISLSQRDGSCIGGHLAQGRVVNTTAELVIGELPQIEFHQFAVRGFLASASTGALTSSA
jgi:predicted DNA-binding protein with PD1-like motif